MAALEAVLGADRLRGRQRGVLVLSSVGNYDIVDVEEEDHAALDLTAGLVGHWLEAIRL